AKLTTNLRHRNRARPRLPPAPRRRASAVNHTPVQTPRRTLAQLLMRSNAIIALVTMAVFTLLISLLVDQRIHNQADALLLQLVRTEADSAREPHGLHVHDTSLSINTMEGQLAEKFSLIY